jgi:hypothetical protein
VSCFSFSVVCRSSEMHPLPMARCARPIDIVKEKREGRKRRTRKEGAEQGDKAKQGS